MKYLLTVSVIIFFLSCNRKRNTFNEDKLDYYFSEAYNSEISINTRLQYVDSARVLVNKQSDIDSLKLKNVFKLANRYDALLKYENYFQASKLALDLAKKKGDSLSIAKAEYYLGDYYFYKFKNDSAFFYYQKARKIYQNSTDQNNLAITTLHIARVLMFEKDFLGSEIETINALKIAKEIEDDNLIYECYDNLGRVLEGQKNYEKSLDYYFKSLDQLRTIKNEVNLSLLEVQTYNNIAHVYLSNGHYKKAIEYYKKALQNKNLKQSHPALYASVLDYFAYSNFKLNKNSIHDFQEALNVRDSINDIAGKIKSRLHLTEFFLSKKDTIKAKALNQEAYLLAKKSNYNKEVLVSLDLSTKIDPKNGLKYAQQYIKLSDSLQEQERNTRNKLARIEFETDEIIQEKEIISNQNTLLLLISAVLLFFGTLLYIILYQRSKQKQLIFANEQQLANEKIYELMLEQQSKLDEARNSEKKRIARELHDGVMNKLASTRLNLFILNKKKDDETIQKCISHINDIQNIEKEVRSIAHELTNNLISVKSNFNSVLKELFQEQKELYSSKCNCFIDESINWETIPTVVKINIYRILQESLNNVNKYANAETIDVSISLIQTNLVLKIVDDGVGFNVNKNKKGIGLQNMYERAENIGAEFSIDSELNLGTKITLIYNLNL